MSGQLGNGSVQTVATTSQPAIGSSFSFVLGTAGVDAVLGSGAIDGIRICARQELGEDGCTPGYWKNHTENWEEYTPDRELRTLLGDPRQPLPQANDTANSPPS